MFFPFGMDIVSRSSLQDLNSPTSDDQYSEEIFQHHSEIQRSIFNLKLVERVRILEFKSNCLPRSTGSVYRFERCGNLTNRKDSINATCFTSYYIENIESNSPTVFLHRSAWVSLHLYLRCHGAFVT